MANSGMDTQPTTDHRFSIVVIHRNGEQRLLDFLTSAAAVIDPTQDEIIVVDNHSTDGSPNLALKRFPDISLITNDYNTGYASACNQGIRQSRGAYILLCNNDLLLPANILNQLLEDFATYPNAGLIGGQLLSPDGTPSRSAGDVTKFWSELGFKPKRKPVFDRYIPSKVEALYGACMAIRQSMLTDTGLLDEDFFFYYEETEWCFRIGQSGWDIVFDPKIAMVHTGGASTKGYSKEAAIELFRSRLLYWQKTMSVIERRILYLWHIPKLVFDALFYLMITAITFGKPHKPKQKLSVKTTMLFWLIKGKPDSWGLPDKK